MPIVFDSLKSSSPEVVEIAKNLLKEGASIKLIAKATGLKESQIKEMQR